jgi:hypothetical protein
VILKWLDALNKSLLPLCPVGKCKYKRLCSVADFLVALQYHYQVNILSITWRRLDSHYCCLTLCETVLEVHN